jgi:hypothetical protein
MRWHHMIGGLALVLLITMLGLPGLSYAQGAGGLTDFRDKSSYSAYDLAQALFAEPAATGTYAWRGAGEGPSVIALTPAVSGDQCAVRAEFSHASGRILCGGGQARHGVELAAVYRLSHPACRTHGQSGL